MIVSPSTHQFDLCVLVSWTRLIDGRCVCVVRVGAGVVDVCHSRLHVCERVSLAASLAWLPRVSQVCHLSHYLLTNCSSAVLRDGYASSISWIPIYCSKSPPQRLFYRWISRWSWDNWFPIVFFLHLFCKRIIRIMGTGFYFFLSPKQQCQTSKEAERTDPNPEKSATGLILSHPAWARGTPFPLLPPLSIHFLIFCSFFTFSFSRLLYFCPSLSFLPE